MSDSIQNIKLYEPSLPQLRFLDIIHNKKPVITLANMGRQVGKTYVDIFDAISWSMNNSKHKTMFISPTYANNTRIMSDVDTHFYDHREMQSRIFAEIKWKEQQYTFHNGAILKMNSAEQGDNLRGPSQDRIYVDEAAFMARSIITEILLPMITRTNGNLILTSTPNGRNWFYDWFNQGQPNHLKYNPERLISLRADYRELNDPNVDKIIEIFRDTMTTDEFNREVMAQFITDETLFNNVENCTQPIGHVVPVIDGDQLFIGIDIGISSDFTVVTVMNQKGEVVEIDAFNMKANKLTHTEFKDRIMKLYYKYFNHLVAVYIERNNQDLLIEELEDNYPDSYKLFPFSMQTKTKGEVVSNLRHMFDKEEISIPDDSQLINELYGYKAKKSLLSGRLQYSNKGVDHDDYVVSLGLAGFAKLEEMDSGVVYTR